MVSFKIIIAIVNNTNMNEENNHVIIYKNDYRLLMVMLNVMVGLPVGEDGWLRPECTELTVKYNIS